MDSSSKNRNDNRIHLEKARYLYEKWRTNRMLYEEQLRTGKDNGIHFCVTKNKHPKFKDFEPLDLKRYLKDWQLEYGDIDSE